MLESDAPLFLIRVANIGLKTKHTKLVSNKIKNFKQGALV
jgi:hypothetical protein